MFKSGEIYGKITKHLPGGMVEVDYAGTLITLPASDNELIILNKSDLSNTPLYHGTILETWKNTPEENYLFLVNDYCVAEKHALDRAADYEYNSKGGATPIIVKIDVSKIQHLKWVEDDDDGSQQYKTWQESYNGWGSFVVVGKFDISDFEITKIDMPKCVQYKKGGTLPGTIKYTVRNTSKKANGGEIEKYTVWLGRLTKFGMRGDTAQETFPPEHPKTKLRIEKVKINLAYAKGEIDTIEYQNRIEALEAVVKAKGGSIDEDEENYDDEEDGSYRTLLSLFDYSGTWSKPFADAGWNVIQWDIKLSELMDINLLDSAETVLDMFENVDGILAAVPCTDFTVSGAQFWPIKDEDGRTRTSIELVEQVMRLVNLFTPTDPEYDGPWFWAIENPVGRMDKLVNIGRKPWYFDPYEFAGWLPHSKADLKRLDELRAKDGVGLTRDDAYFVQQQNAYTKKTGLWGDFAIPEKKPLAPVYAKQGSTRTSPMAALTGGKSAKTKELRSNTPLGFAKAFYEANKNYRAHRVAERNNKQEIKVLKEAIKYLTGEQKKEMQERLDYLQKIVIP